MSDGRNDISFLRLAYLIALAGCLVPCISRGQQITHVDFEVTGSTVKITYDVTSCSANEDFDVRLSLGQNGELSEIKRGLSGDIEHVACGSSNLIVWDVLADRAELKGPISFTVEILRTHPIINTDEYPIAAYEPEDGRSAGAIPYGDPTTTYAPRQSPYVAPPRFFQVAPWIVLEVARAAMLARGHTRAVLQGRIGPAFPQPRRHR
jgi:hypothetical protein